MKQIAQLNSPWSSSKSIKLSFSRIFRLWNLTKQCCHLQLTLWYQFSIHLLILKYLCYNPFYHLHLHMFYLVDTFWNFFNGINNCKGTYIEFSSFIYNYFINFSLHTKQLKNPSSWSVWTYKWNINLPFISMTKNKSLLWWIKMFMNAMCHIIIVHLESSNATMWM
jgi:hypothetical protein